jgi:hypothetical protein
VAVEITPEPSEEERRAILRALELEQSEDNDEPTPWRRVGLSPADDGGSDTWPNQPRP